MLLSGCNREEPCVTCPPIYHQSIFLDTVLIEPTEIALHLTTSDSIHNSKTFFQIRRDSVIVFSRFVLQKDTVITDTGLLPSHNYKYKAFRFKDSMKVDSSKLLSLMTMDTTSHNFTWEVDTLGDGNSSALYDVLILNDTLVYATGGIYTKDSTGEFDPNTYNLVKWDGNKWELMRIQFLTFCGQSYVGSYPGSAIFGFSAQDVWIASGSQIVRWNGETQSFPVCIPISVIKLWGENSNSMYAVGHGGGIAYYTNGTWRKIESGTTLDIQDIWGSTNPGTGQLEILAVAANPYSSYDRKILKLSGTIVSTLSDSNISWPLGGVWFMPSRHYYVVGSGIYEKKSLSDAQWMSHILDITTYYTNRIRGTDINNITFCGAYGDCYHFNGTSWYSFHNEVGLSNGQYLSLDVKGDLVFEVGSQNAQAVVARGKRF